MKKLSLLSGIMLLLSYLGIGQSVAINDNGDSPHSSAILDLQSTKKGFLLPRMTSEQRNAIEKPADGLVVFDTDIQTFFIWTKGKWADVSSTNFWNKTGNNIYYNNEAGNVGIGTNTPQAALHIKGGQTNKLLLENPTADDYVRIILKHSTSDRQWDIAGLISPGSPGEDRLNFFNNAFNEVLSLTGDGKVGIRTTSPNAPLGFPAELGKKITLYPGETGDAGLAVLGNELRIHSDYAGADITLGFDNKNSGFTERMRIKGSGFLLAKFTNPATEGDRTALIDIENGDKVLWRYGVGGTGNGLGINKGQFYIEKEGGGASFLTIATDGNIGIGTINPQHKLSVNGTIQSKEVRVETGWADYVFDNKYRLRSLQEVEAFIKANHHLPDIPSAKEVQQNGLAVGEMQTKMMQKIEELTLYLIDANKEIEELKQQVKQLQKEK